MEFTSTSEQQFLKRLIEIIEANLHNEQFGVNELARELGMSRITLHRKVKSTVKKSISEFIREARLKRANELLLQKAGTVSEIAYRVGFGSATYFNRCFHDFYGVTPGDIIKRIVPVGYENQNKKKKLHRIHILSIIIPTAAVLAAFLYTSSTIKNNVLKKKTIAVLPFTNNSPETNNNYIIDGLRDEIISQFVSLKDMTLVSRVTSEKYKGSTKRIKDIGRELKAKYILTGSGQTLNGRTRIRLQLIDATTEKNLWAKPYEEEIKVDNIFEIQKEIAQLVLKDLNIYLSIEDTEFLKKKDTLNFAAYASYLHGNDYYKNYTIDQDSENLMKSKKYFEKALSIDSAYALAWCKLAWVLFQESKFGTSPSKRDSAILLVNKSIRIDPKLSEAWSLKGFLFQGQTELALEAFHNAIKYGPNKPEGYHQLANFYCNYCEYTKTIEFSLKSIEANNEPLVHDWTFINLSVAFSSTGFFEEAEKYGMEYLKQYANKKTWLQLLQFEEISKGNFQKSIEYGIEAYQLDSADLTTLDYLGQNYLFIRDYRNALKYYQKYVDNLKLQPNIRLFRDNLEFAQFNNRHENKIGHDVFPLLHASYVISLYDKNLSDELFKGLQSIISVHFKNNSSWSKNGFCNFELACILSSKNQNQQAIECLAELKKRKTFPVWMPVYMKYSPILDEIRNHPEFENTLKEVEKLSQTEHEKIKKLLISKGLETT